MKLKARHTFLGLCFLFLVYSFSIYLSPLSEKRKETFDKTASVRGKLVWQNYNCQSCHQLFGLGGYLGPDLTNVISHQPMGLAAMRAIIKSGTKQMPAFNLTDREFNDLIEFLKSADSEGKSDPRSFKTNYYGMIDSYE